MSYTNEPPVITAQFLTPAYFITVINGIFIKKENIGLIEVMGLAVLPSRLVEELDAVADAIIKGFDMNQNEKTVAHKTWAEEVVKNHLEIDSSNVDEILKKEVGKVFVNVLEHAGVYKRDEEGRKAFDKFMNQI